MIQIQDKLYYSGATIKQQLPGKTDKDKDTQLGQWRKCLGDLTHEIPTDVENAYAIPGMKVDSAFEGQALTDKLNSGSTIFHYASVAQMNQFLRRLQEGNPEDTSAMLRPADMLDQKRDLTMRYDQGKACVLQALINLEVPNPNLGKAQQEDPRAWHVYYVTNNIMYDDDPVLYQIYTGLGLRLVLNQATEWSKLSPMDVPPGKYVFNTPGHNFAVLVHDSADATTRYEPKDAPQNVVTGYDPGRTISYAWLYP